MPPEFLADRDLGKRVVVLLREAGMVVHTLAEIFGGERQAQQATDTQWIEVAGRQRWIALTKNHRIRYSPLEQETVTAHRALLFALANGNLGFVEMAAAFVVAMPKMAAQWEQQVGGQIWIVQRDGGIEQVWPRPPAEPVS